MERQFVVRAQGGDHDAFATLAAASIVRLTTVARLVVGDTPRAQDAVQEALIAAWRNLPGLRDPDRFEAWLHRLLLRACLAELRRDRRQPIVEIPVAALRAPTVAAADRDLLVRDELERGLRALVPEHRAVLVVTYYLDLPMADAARMLDLPVGTVKSRPHRALAALRARLEADARDPSPTAERFA